MASAILVAAASQVPGPLGFFAVIAAGVAGAYIDNELFGADIPRNDFQPDIPDQQIASEGGPAVYVLGPEAIVQGQIIWMDTRGITGKIPDETTSVAIAVARGETEEVERMFSRSLDLLIRTAEINFASTTIEIVNVYKEGYLVWQLVLREPKVGGFDLTTLVGDRSNTIAISGWANSLNNIGAGAGINSATPGQVVGVSSDASYTYALVDIPVQRLGQPLYNRPVVEGPGRLIAVRQTFAQRNPNYTTQIDYHTGAPGQIPNAHIVSLEPVGTVVPAFEGLSYVVLQNFKVEDFGRRVPEDMTVAVRQGPTITLADAIDKIIGEWYGWDADTWDTSRIRKYSPDTYIRGYMSRGNRSATDRLQDLVVAYDFSAYVDNDGVLRFFPNSHPYYYEVPASEFLEPLSLTPAQDVQLPTSVTVTFRDAENARYEIGSVHEQINVRGLATGSATTLDLTHLTITAAEAKLIARRALWLPWQTRTTVKGRLAPRWMLLGNGVAIRTTWEGVPMTVLLTKVETGADWSVQFDGRRVMQIRDVQEGSTVV